VIHFLKDRLGLFVYAVASILESTLNLIMYITCLDKFKVFDFSFPLYFWYTDVILKRDFLEDTRRKSQDI